VIKEWVLLLEHPLLKMTRAITHLIHMLEVACHSVFLVLFPEIEQILQVVICPLTPVLISPKFPIPLLDTSYPLTSIYILLLQDLLRIHGWTESDLAEQRHHNPIHS